jgi:uncharacterized protein YdbL (DUF1318 family)
MKFLRGVNLLSFSLLVGSLSACLTLNVNVHFPESAVQQATDNYVHDLYLQKGKGKPAKKETDSPTDLEGTPKSPTTLNHPVKKQALLEYFFMSQSWAAEGTLQFRIDSPKSAKIKERLAANLTEVLTQKKAGTLGETSDGKLIIKNSQALKALFLKKVEKIVADENTARDELYEEVLISNRLPKNNLLDVKKSFAKSFQMESPAGTWIQDQNGSWRQKD